MLKISVIIPVYNAEKYLRTTLNCLLSQTLKELEVICINDCSKDGSLAILNEYSQKDERVNIDLDVYQKVCERFDNWDKKSIVYECDVLPEYKKFYQKYSKPVFVPRKNTFSENIFSIRNIGTPDEKRKQLTILGLRFKFKSSKKVH